MAGVDESLELESDIEICVVDDDVDDDDTNCDNAFDDVPDFTEDENKVGSAEKVVDDDENVSMEVNQSLAPAAEVEYGEEPGVKGDKMEENAIDESQLFLEPMPLDCKRNEVLRRGTGREDRVPEADIECATENETGVLQHDFEDSCNNKSDGSSSGSDDEEEEFYDNQDDVFKRFYFESDHLAFKHNKDYKTLLRALIVLEAERISSVKDLEDLQIWKETALEDPISFVESLRSKNPPKLPERKQVPVLPTIDWMQYLTSTDMVHFDHDFKVKTRRSFRSKVEGDKKDDMKTEHGLDDENGCSPSDSTDQSKLVRGRLMEEGKTMTFNRLWTNEEQEKLERLLQVYPPEEVEARRWEKIARALGNRTPKQVSSRVQKYFIKLARAGLPIPGRVPHLTTQRKSKINPVSYRNSTFFPSWKPSIYMNDDDDDETSSVTTIQSDDTPYASDDEVLPSDVKESAEYKELINLKRLKREFKESKTQCSFCGVTPIKGPHYRCTDCPEDQPYDLCGQCLARHKQGALEAHPSWHQMVLDEKSAPFVDGDYMSFELQQGKYNYLDPNFTPNVR